MKNSSSVIDLEKKFPNLNGVTLFLPNEVVPKNRFSNRKLLSISSQKWPSSIQPLLRVSLSRPSIRGFLASWSRWCSHVRRSSRQKEEKKRREGEGEVETETGFPQTRLALDRRKASSVRGEITMVDVEISWNEPLFYHRVNSVNYPLLRWWCRATL